MRKSLFIVLLAAAAALCSCENSYPVFSTRYHVNFRCDASQPPFNAVMSGGVFLSVRCPGTELIVTDADGHVSRWPMSESDRRSSAFGLGGIIIGTPFIPDENGPVYAYDLACPICEKASVRLSFGSDGIARCPSCGTSFDLNNNGFVISTESGSNNPLYRYPVTQGLQYLTVSNLNL